MVALYHAMKKEEQNNATKIQEINYWEERTKSKKQELDKIVKQIDEYELILLWYTLWEEKTLYLRLISFYVRVRIHRQNTQRNTESLKKQLEFYRIEKIEKQKQRDDIKARYERLIVHEKVRS